MFYSWNVRMFCNKYLNFSTLTLNFSTLKLFYTANDSPQPQVLLAFGFTNTNPFPFIPPE